MAKREDRRVSQAPSLAWVRRRSGYSQRQLNARAGVNHITISRIENGQPAFITTLKKLADALGVQVSDLIKQPPVE